MIMATLEPKLNTVRSRALRNRPRFAWARFGFDLLCRLRRPVDEPQPEWARVSRRTWRRHSALLTCLYEERNGGMQ